MDMPPVLLLWQDVDSVDCDADETELLQLPLNRSTVDRPILMVLLCARSFLSLGF